MEYLTAAQIIADPEMSSEEKLRKLKEIEGQPQPAPERVLQTLDRPNSTLSGPGYGVAAPMLSQPVVLTPEEKKESLNTGRGAVGIVEYLQNKRAVQNGTGTRSPSEPQPVQPPGGGVGTRMPSGIDLTTDEWESYRRILQKHAEARTIPGYVARLQEQKQRYVAGGNKYTEWEAANKEPVVETAEPEIKVPVAQSSEWVSAYNDILTDPRISLAEKTRILDEYRGKSESDVKLRTLGKPVGNIEAFEGDPLGNPYPGYVETDEGLEQGPRPGTARRFVRLPTQAGERKLETLDRPGSKLSGPGYPQRLNMRYLATEGPKTTGEIFWDAVDAAADVAAAPIAPYVKAGVALLDRDADIEAKREAAPRIAAAKEAEVKKTRLEQAREDYEAGNLTEEEYSNILDKIDPLPPPTAAPAPRPASARAAAPKKPEEPKPWFTEDNAPDTVFNGTDPLSGLVPSTTQVKGNIYPSHLEWEAPVPYTANNPDAKKAADIDAEIAKLQEQISALENNPTVKSYQAGIDILIANRDKIAADVADGIISPVEGNLNTNQINTRIAKLEELKEKELAKPPSQELIDLNKKKIVLIDQRRKITITGNNASDFVAGLATQLDIPEAEVRAKLLTNDGIQSKDKDGYVKYNLVQNPETGELELVKSKAKYRTAQQMQRDALDATVSAGRFKIPFEREANIETQENVQNRQADLEKKIVEIQLAGAKLNKRQVDPQRWMRNASLGNKVGAMMYMTLQGIWGGPEYAKKAADDITDLIKQDIDLQLRSITKDKEYVDFLKEDIGRIDKMFEGREKQIAAKHIIALEKAIQAAKMMPGADPAMVDYLEAEWRMKQANEIKTIDEADKKEAYFGWAAPAAPKYGGGGGGGGKEKGSGQTINGVRYSNDYLEKQGWFKDQYGGRPSPNALYAQANQLDSQIVPRLEAYIKAGGSINELIVTPEIKGLIISAATLIQQGASDKDQETSNEVLGYAGYKRIRDPRRLVAQIKEVAAMRRSYALSLTQLDPAYGEAPEKKQETKDK